MASSGYAVDPFSGRPEFDVILDVWDAGTSGNSKRFGWRLTARQFSSYDSYSLGDYPWSVNVEGSAYSGSNFTPDFRGSVNSIVIASGTTPYKSADSNGYLTVNFSFSVGPAGIFGSASKSGSFSANRIAQVPDAPPNPVWVSSTPTTLTFNIYAPSDNGGSAIKTYNIEVRRASDNVLMGSWQSGSSSQTTPSSLNLQPNTQYKVRYAAINGVGTGAYSGYNTMTTAVGKPSAPGTPTATNLAPTSLTLNWTAPSSNGGAAITNYVVQRARDSGFTLDSTSFNAGTALSYPFNDLDPSTDYYFRVAATNSAGTGAWSLTLKVSTVSGVYYSDGSNWIPCGVFYSDGTNWIPVELVVSNGTAWVIAV